MRGEKMDRLTERYKDSIANTVLIRECGDKLCKDICDDIKCNCSKCGLEKAFEKLADYEELEEQGLLLKFPCKVGDSVFIIVGKDISKQKVKEIRIFDNRIEFVTSRRAFGIGAFGGHVFLTRKEAEEQLELLKVMYF